MAGSLEILLCSEKNFWTPQSRMYFSQSSKILVSRHPMEIVEEILYTYCPQCLSKFSEDDAYEAGNVCPTCKLCPRCDGVLQNKSPDTPPVCTSCAFTTPHDSPISNQDATFKEVYSALLTQYQSLSKKKSILSRRGDQDETHWKMAHLEKKLQDTEARRGEVIDYLSDKRGIQIDSAVVEKAISVRLRSKRTVRCRKDMEEGKLNILVQPKPYPLDGDSSMKLQTGDWWVKDSSAIHFIPFVTVVRIPSYTDLMSIEWCTLSLRFRNSRDSPATIFFENSGNLQRDERYVVVNYDGSISVEPSKTLLVPSTAFGNGNSNLSLTLEAYEDELLRGDEPKTESSMTNLGTTDSSEGNSSDDKPWSFRVDGHNAFLDIPIRLNSSSVSLALSNQQKFEINIGYKLLVDDIDLAIRMKILLQH